jgi:hypothetical protein
VLPRSLKELDHDKRRRVQRAVTLGREVSQEPERTAARELASWILAHPGQVYLRRVIPVLVGTAIGVTFIALAEGSSGGVGILGGVILGCLVYHPLMIRAADGAFKRNQIKGAQ